MVGDGWVICVATAQEVHPLKRPLSLRGSGQPSPYPIFEGTCGGKPVLVLQTGVGPQRAASASSWVLSTRRCAGLISLGLSGSLHASLVRGSIVIGRRWVCLEGQPVMRRTVGPSADPSMLDRAFSAAAACGLTLREGPLLTIDRVVGAPEKRALAEETGAIAVDMESGAVAGAAMAASVSCVAVRAILDPLDQTLALLPEQFLRPDGSLSLWKSGRMLAMHPGAWPTLLALGRSSSRSMGQLARWVDRFLNAADSEV
jgi:adenosylhomocysteine nucleosidase